MAIVVEAADPDAGDALTFSLVTWPSGMSINAITGVIQWTPDESNVGAHQVTVRVEDMGALSDTQSFVTNVENVNGPPMITSTAVTTATEDQAYSYDVEAADLDAGDILTFSLVTSPSGMSINAATGVIQWTPDSSQV
jgi:hypothetical protein